jgi:HSP20 family protein
MSWHPLQEMEIMRRSLDRVFDEMTQLPREQQVTWKPAIELQDRSDNLILRAEIPGVEGKDLDVRVTREAVVIQGEHRYEKKHQDRGAFRSEFRYGKFGRLIPLPVAVENNKVQADFTNGILTLTLPKVGAAKKHIVKVNVTEPVAENIEAPSEQPIEPEAAVQQEPLVNVEMPLNTETDDVWASETPEPTAA